MGSSFRLGRVFGVPVGLSPSWFIAFALVMGVLAMRIYPDAIPARSADLYWAMAFVSGLLFFLSILLHELAHSVVAKAFGIPVKGITLFILGGVSQITREAPKARQELLMAFAGPATSFVLAGLALLAWTAAGPGQTPVTIILEWLWLMNFGLGAFNMVPGFPLDGGRVLRATLWGVSGSYSGATRWSSYIGRGIAWLMMGYGAFILLLGPRLGWGTDALGGVWLILIGAFLDVGAKGSWLHTRALLRLREFTVNDALERDWPQVAPFAILSDVEAEGMLADDDDHLLVVEDGRVIGVAPGDQALRALERPFAQASEVMIPAASFAAVAGGESALEAWHRMDGADIDLLPVVEGARFAGLVRRRQLIELMQRDGRGLPDGQVDAP